MFLLVDTVLRKLSAAYEANPPTASDRPPAGGGVIPPPAVLA